jgi:Xaa-Pro dipeptidase
MSSEIGAESALEINSEESLQTESAEKAARLQKFFEQHQLAAVLLRRSENIAWATCGQVDARVLIPSPTWVASILLTRDGRKYYFAPANEGPRLAAEEFNGLGYEPVLSHWYEDNSVASAQRLAGSVEVGTDVPTPGLISVNLAPLRASLTEPEIARYRWLGRKTADVTTGVLKELEPGVSEYEMEALVSDGLLCEGILPSVLLMAVDDRVLHYKHAVARGQRLERYGMLNLCSRKWGLAISITRFVHFGALPNELAERFAACERVNAALLDATRVGVTSGQLFNVVRDAYVHEGFPGEEEFHHQGGASGYGEREWLATPAGRETVVNHQAFAWNPSIRGTKVEDTVVLHDGAIEILTETPELPVVETRVDGVTYRSAGVLVRSS